MRTLLMVSGLVLSACSTLQGALLPGSIEIGGQQVMTLPKTGNSHTLEAALAPARGKHVRVRVEEGVKYQSLQLLLVIASSVGVSVVELEHGGCRHDFPADLTTEQLGSQLFTVALAPEGYYLAMTSPPPANSDGETGPTIAAVNGSFPFDALEAWLKKDLPPGDGVILAAKPDVGATDVLRTWDVLQRQPGVRKVMLASF